jgi:hypothetical protein
MTAIEKARTLLLKSHSEQISEYSGEQFEQVMAQIAMENQLKEQLGLMPTVQDLPDPATDPVEPGEPDDDQGVETQPARP